MHFLIVLFFILITSYCNAKDNYEFKIMGNSIKNDIIELPDKSIFNIFEAKGAFTDNNGNIGDFSSRGVRQTNENGKLIKITAVLSFETTDGSQMWGYPTRINSDLLVGAGYFDVFFSTGILSKLSKKKCQYGLTVTKQNSFVMQGFCK